jgi:hypothetical protein
MKVIGLTKGRVVDESIKWRRKRRKNRYKINT